MHTLITSISPVLLLFELSVIPDTEQVLTYESYHYFITRTQNGTIDKGYSKRAIYYISIAIFFFSIYVLRKDLITPWNYSFLSPLKSDISS